MYRHRRKQLPPPPPPAHGGATRERIGNPLSEGTYSHPRAAPLPPPTSPAQAQAQVSDPVITPSFPLGALPGLLPFGGTSYDTQPQPQPQSEPRRRRPLRPTPWRTPSSPQRPPPGRLCDRAFLSLAPQRPAGKRSRFRSGSLPGTHYFRGLDEQVSSCAERPGIAYTRDGEGVQSSSREVGRVVVSPVLIIPSGLGSGGMSPAVDGRREPSAFGIPKPKIPLLSKLPTRKLVAGNDHGTAEEKGGGVSTATSRRVDDVGGQVLGLRVPLRKGSKNHGGVRMGRRQSPDSVYSQDMEGSEGRESILAQTYHGFMFGDQEHGNGEERSQGCVDGSEKKGDDRRWEPLRTTPGPPLESHYRRQNPIVSPIEPGHRLEGWGRGEREPTSPTPIRTGTTTRILRKPARLNLRPPSTQQVLRTPSPLSATLKRPGPHVPHGGRVGVTPAPTSMNDVPAGGASHAAPMFARELTASPEVMSSVAAEEDDRRGMVSRWSTDSSDMSDSSNSSDEEVMNREGLSVSGGRRLTREAEGETGQEIAQEVPSAKDNSSSSSSNNNREHSHASQEAGNEGIEQQKSEELIFSLENLTTQLANLQAPLNHLVSQVTSVETAFGPVREAMVGLRQKATETLVDTRQFLEEAKGVERQLAEARRQVKGKATEVVGNSEDHQEQQAREQEENGRHREGNDDHKGHEMEQYMEREAKKEGQQRSEEPREGPHAPKPRRGPPSRPAPGGAEWV